MPQYVWSHQREHNLQPNKHRNVSQKLVWRKDNVILGNRRHDVRMRIRRTIVVLSKRVVHPYELNFIVYYRHRFGQRFELHVFWWCLFGVFVVEISFTSASANLSEEFCRRKMKHLQLFPAKCQIDIRCHFGLHKLLLRLIVFTYKLFNSIF